ncbi:MAG: hypothetical protein GX845_05840 [Erysipelothrix sp.]|nr:hypothetical protein [Erysipelothrix sp.]
MKLAYLDQTLKDGLKKNQSIAVILKAHQLTIAPSTVYRDIDMSQLSIKNIDLKRKVICRQHYTHKPKAKPMTYEYLKGRTFIEFQTRLICYDF